MQQAVEQEIEVIVHRRTPGSGHLTAAMPLQDAVAFADAELAQGRAVIVEVGRESMLVRTGKEIVDFIHRALGGRKGPKPEVSTLTPMAGGAADVEAPAIPQMPYAPRYEAPENPRGLGGPRIVASPEVDLRAWRALVEKIGERGAQGILAGGGYAVRSKLWPYIVYVVAPDIIKVVNQGMQVSRICIVTPAGGSVWDTVLSRIQLLESGEDGEVQVFATGQLTQG